VGVLGDFVLAPLGSAQHHLAGIFQHRQDCGSVGFAIRRAHGGVLQLALAVIRIHGMYPR